MKDLRHHLTFLKVLATCTPKERNEILKEAPPQSIEALSEVCKNILNGNVKLSPKLFNDLKRYKRTIRHIAYKTLHKTPKKLKSYLCKQRGGLVPLLPLLLTGLTSVLGGVAGRAIAKVAGV